MSVVDMQSWLCSGLLTCFVGWMNGCISTQTRSVYRLHKFRIRSCFISGAVCVLGGRLVMSRMIFFCILMSG